MNLLVLDEPTNHLDLPSCDVLEDALRVYTGTVLLVTHDRHLIRNTCDALIEVRGGRAIWHEGVPEKVLNPLGTVKADLGADTPKAAAAPKKQAKKKQPKQDPSPAGGASAKDKKERKRQEAEARNASHASTKSLRNALKTAERKWEKAEAKVADLQNQLADPAVYEDKDRMQELITAHDEAKEHAADLMVEWENATLALEAAGG